MEIEIFDSFWMVCANDQIKVKHKGEDCTVDVETLYQAFAERFRRENRIEESVCGYDRIVETPKEG